MGRGYSPAMGKVTKVPMDDWLASYVRDYAFDTLTPSERMQFRMACAAGPQAVAKWAEQTLPKYKLVWQRLKSAQRQRRYRKSAARDKWLEEWKAADKNLGTQFTSELRRFRERLRAVDGTGNYDTPGAVLNAAFGALSERLDALDSRGPRSAAPHFTMTNLERFAKPRNGADG